MSTPELAVDDVIGQDWWFTGVTAKSVNRWLKDNAKAKEILVRVNSPGGDVHEGFAIMNALKRSDARVIVEIEGLAASAASVIAMAGDEIRVHQGAMVMIHEAWGIMAGSADDFEARAELLRKINVDAAAVYAARTGQSNERVLELMAAETWMTADEAKSLGFVDTVIAAKGRVSSAPRNQSRAMALLSSYRSKRGVEAFAASATSIPAAERAQDMESDDMNEEQILKQLGYASMADLQAATLRLKALETAAGVVGDECVGVLRAALTSHTDALPKAQKRIADLEKLGQSHELASLFAQAEKDKKLTPAIRDNVQAAFDAGHVTLEGAKSWLANLLPVAALAAAPKAAAPSTSPELSADQKELADAFAKMSGGERAALKKSDPERYAAMRAAHQANPKR